MKRWKSISWHHSWTVADCPDGAAPQRGRRRHFGQFAPLFCCGLAGSTDRLMVHGVPASVSVSDGIGFSFWVSLVRSVLSVSPGMARTLPIGLGVRVRSGVGPAVLASKPGRLVPGLLRPLSSLCGPVEKPVRSAVLYSVSCAVSTAFCRLRCAALEAPAGPFSVTALGLSATCPTTVGLGVRGSPVS